MDGQEGRRSAKEDSNAGLLERYHQLCIQQVKGHLIVISIAVVAVTAVHLKLHPIYYALILWLGSYMLLKKLRSLKADLEYILKRQEAKKLLSSDGPSDSGNGSESVEWINLVLARLWPLISPDIFGPVVDLLEDTLKELAPGIVTTVRVEDFDQGRHPLQLSGFKVIEDNDPWVQKQLALSDTPGEWVSFEVEFCYRGNFDRAELSNNVHLFAYFGIGLQKLASCEMPVFVQIDGICGKIKLRLQLQAVQPFVKDATFSFSNVPEVEITAKPMQGPNVMSLPLISHFIQSSVNVLLAKFSLPAYYTLDLAQILLGDDAIKRSRHMGVAVIAIHYLKDITIPHHLRSNFNLYVSVSFMHSASKPKFSTRIHHKEPGPTFEEMAFLLITSDQLIEREQIILTVCDSERVSADEPLGSVTILIEDLVKDSGHMKSQTSRLSDCSPGVNPQGSLSWSGGFFAAYESSPLKAKVKNTAQTVATASPSNSGILLIHIQSLADLEIRMPQSSRSANPKMKRNSNDECDLPSTYCIVLLNDVKIFETRVKKYSSDPYINSGIEYFVPDFMKARIDVVVMQVRAREHNSIIGIVSIPLASTLAIHNQLTKWWTLKCGSGSGKMRASILFQSVAIELNKALCGWAIATMEIFSISIVGLQHTLKNCRLKLTVESSDHQREQNTAESDSKFKDDHHQIDWVFKPRLRLPVTTRMQAKLTVQVFRKPTRLSEIKGREVYHSVTIWLAEIPDDEIVQIEFELFETARASRLRRSNDQHHSMVEQSKRKPLELPSAYGVPNVPPETPKRNRNENQGPSEVIQDASQDRKTDSLALDRLSTHGSFSVADVSHLEEHAGGNATGDAVSSNSEPEELGRQDKRPVLQLQFRVIPGVSNAHRVLQNKVPGVREVYSTYLQAVRSGQRLRNSPSNYEPSPEAPASNTQSYANEPSNPVEDAERSLEAELDVPRNEETLSPTSLFLTGTSFVDSENHVFHECPDNWTDDDESDSEADSQDSSMKGFNSMNPDDSNQLRHMRQSSKPKAGRTISWMKDSAKIGLRKAKNRTKRQIPKRAVEKETLSSF